MGAPVLSVRVLGNHPHVKDTTTRKSPVGARRKQNSGGERVPQMKRRIFSGSNSIQIVYDLPEGTRNPKGYDPEQKIRKRFKTREEYMEHRKRIRRQEELRKQLKQINQRLDAHAREELHFLIHCDLR